MVLAGFGQTIRERLQAGGTAGTIPGNRPHKQTGGGGMVPLTADTCIRCGQCVRQCPAEAIDREDPEKVDAGKCISCMGCVAICPKQAKALDAVQLARVEGMLEAVCAERKSCELY